MLKEHINFNEDLFLKNNRIKRKNLWKIINEIIIKSN
jgi:hypothetical protein